MPKECINLNESGEDIDALSRIKEAKELLDMEIISEEEFKQIKNKYMKQINKSNNKFETTTSDSAINSKQKTGINQRLGEISQKQNPPKNPKKILLSKYGSKNVEKIENKDLEEIDELFIKSPIASKVLIEELCKSLNLNFSSKEELLKYLNRNYSFAELKSKIDVIENEVLERKVEKSKKITKEARSKKGFFSRLFKN